MSSSTSSSEPSLLWRRFFLLAAGTAASAVATIYLFVALVDPWATLPLSLPVDRVPVTSNQRFAYPTLARSAAFDSAVFGTSTSRLLRPSELNPAFGARFVNLAMNSATPFETSSLLTVFAGAHPKLKMVVLGVDGPWCVTGQSLEKLTPRPFPDWMYQSNRWAGYREMFNLFAVQEAGKEFGVLVGIKKPDMGRDGFTSFVPPDDTYDAARALEHIRTWDVRTPAGERTGPPAEWRYPALEVLRDDLAELPASARKILMFSPYNHQVMPAAGSDGAAVWSECKRRVAALAKATPNTMAVDFMRPGPITDVDENYWDPLHYRIGVADRLARDLSTADRGLPSADYEVLWGGS